MSIDWSILKVYDEGDRTSPTGWHTHNFAIRAIMTRTHHHHHHHFLY